MPTPELNATLVKREDLNEYLMIFQARFDDGPVPEFRPGQFAMIGLPPDPNRVVLGKDGKPKKQPALVRRAYSIASAGNNPDHLEFFVILVEDGELTPVMWRLQENSRLWIDKKIRGDFTLDDVPGGKDLLFIATGTGLAPFLSMLRTFNPDRWRRVALIHGVRVSPDLGYRSMLEQFAKDHPWFRYIPSVTREPEDSPYDGPRGRVPLLLTPDRFESLAGFPLDPNDAHVFLCGNPAMITDVEAHLIKGGFAPHSRSRPDGNIHYERYW